MRVSKLVVTLQQEGKNPIKLKLVGGKIHQEYTEVRGGAAKAAPAPLFGYVRNVLDVIFHFVFDYLLTSFDSPFYLLCILSASLYC